MSTLPKTKFCAPLPSRDLIQRRDLWTWLQNKLSEYRVVLLSAPAGYGKTTLLSSLPELLPGYRLAWWWLDSEDNDLIRFFSSLGEALAAIDPSLQESVRSQLIATTGGMGGAMGFSLRPMMALLVNQMIDLAVPDCVLALDDLQEIHNPAIYEALDYFIEHAPPQFHLAISTREQPPLHLNRLRARRQLAELSAADLSFDAEESQRFLNGLLELGLTDEDLKNLYQKTEGWPVGLVLLTNHLRTFRFAGDRASFLQRLNRFDPMTFRYLADEVLLQQPEEVRDFLLEISVLSELTPSLCQALTQKENAGSLLVEIYRRNLFLSLVREGSLWNEPVYRFHALFADFLQFALRQQDDLRFRALHVRAAEIESGGTAAHPAVAIRHLLVAQEWEAAVEVIEAAGEQFLQEGLHETVSGWIAALPEGLAGQRYRLMYLDGLSDLLKGDLNRARRSLERALYLLEAANDAVVRVQVLVALASLAFIRADFSMCVDLVRQVDPAKTGLRERIEWLMLRASLALFWESNWSTAEKDFKECLNLVRASEDLRMWFLFSLYLAPEFIVLPGMLTLLERFCEEAGARFEKQISPLRLGIEDTWASIHLRRGRMLQAMEVGKDALWVKQQLGGYTFLGMNACLTLASVSIGSGDDAAASEYLHMVMEQVEEAELNRALAGGGLYPLGKFQWLQGRFEEARQTYRKMALLPIRLPFVDVLQKMLGGLLEISAQHYRPAEELLLEAVRAQSREIVSAVYGSARLLLAYLYLRWEKEDRALEQMDILLAQCGQGNDSGLILQDMPFAGPLLRRMVKNGRRVRQSVALLEQMEWPVEEEKNEPALLTERQVEILKLIAEGYSNQAIADRLTLSLTTVKSHLVNIMNRLGVSSRTEAVARARQIGLLP